MGGRGALHRIHPAGAGQRRAGHRAHRGAAAPVAHHPLCRDHRLRPGTGAGAGFGEPAGRRPERVGLRPDRAGHLRRQPERLPVRDESGGDRVRRADRRRGGDRRLQPPAGPARLAAGRGHRVQRQLGRRLDGPFPADRPGLGDRVRHPPADAPLRGRGRPHLGPECDAEHPAEERAVVPRADPAGLQPLPGLAGPEDLRPRPAPAARPPGDPVRARRRHPEPAGRRLREPFPEHLRPGARCEVGGHPEPDGGHHREHRLRPGGGGRPTDQPDSFSAVLPGKETVFPGKRLDFPIRERRRRWTCSSAAGSGSTPASRWGSSAARGCPGRWGPGTWAS